jgi:hypothetical protein
MCTPDWSKTVAVFAESGVAQRLQRLRKKHGDGLT